MSQVVASWSGGKDSCLACYKAILEGFKVSHLLNFASKEERCMSHGLDSKLMVAQSQAIGIPIIQREVSWSTYEDVFKATVMELKRMGVEGVVFGDIDLQEHKDWVNRVCTELDIIAIEPLWGLNPEQILIDFINAGFESIVINVKADLFGEEWLGRRVDGSLIEDLRKLQSRYNIHMCGEFGEYHTLVVDGPIFKKRIKILDSKRVLKGRCWLLEISGYEVEGKGHEENL